MKQLRVAGVMTRDVVTAREDTGFKDLVELMTGRAISAVPIVDDEGRIAGIVSEADLLAVEAEEREPPRRRRFIEWFIDRRQLEAIERRAPSLSAANVMTRDVITARPDTPVEAAIKTLLRARVKRLPVVDDENRVVGIVSRRDLLSPFLREDEEILAEIRDEVVERTMWLDPSTLDIEVQDGVVTLRGTVDRRSTTEILADLVHRVDGVVGVEDDLGFEHDDRKDRPPHQPRPDVVEDTAEPGGYASRSP